MSVQRCQLRAEPGCAVWTDRATGAEVALVVEDGATRRVFDLREQPPFLQLLPCPYCDVAEDAGHLSAPHVNPRLGRRTDANG